MLQASAPVRQRIWCSEASVAVTWDEVQWEGCAGEADDHEMEWWPRLADAPDTTEESSCLRDVTQCEVVLTHRTVARPAWRWLDRLHTAHTRDQAVHRSHLTRPSYSSHTNNNLSDALLYRIRCNAMRWLELSTAAAVISISTSTELHYTTGFRSFKTGG